MGFVRMSTDSVRSEKSRQACLTASEGDTINRRLCLQYWETAGRIDFALRAAAFESRWFAIDFAQMAFSASVGRNEFVRLRYWHDGSGRSLLHAAESGSSEPRDKLTEPTRKMGLSTMTAATAPPNETMNDAPPATSQPKVDKSGAKVRGMFASIAHRYDFLNHFLSANVDKHWRRRATRLAPPPPAGQWIVDCCTGTGDLAVAYDKVADGSNPIVATDFCRPMLVRSVPKFEKIKASDRVVVVEADSQRLPLPSDFAGLTTVAFGLRNISDTINGLDEMIRITRPGGRVAILEFSRPTGRVLGRAYLAFFKRILPRVGQAIAPNASNAYGYLPASVLEFPDGQAMLDLMASRGLTGCTAAPMTLGIATLYIGTKPKAI
jgi:demethylmenaquinone methyltransferase/2-methoxy-6-polyprenyl-1,4-benzoquinol methylase